MKLVSQSRFHLIRMSRLLCLIALAIALDGDGIKFGLGDNGNLSVEVDAENFRLKLSHFWKKCPFLRRKLSFFVESGHFENFTYSPVITTSGDWTQIFAIFILFFWKLDFWLILRIGSFINVYLRFETDEIWINQNHKNIRRVINSTEIKNWLRTLVSYPTCPCNQGSSDGMGRNGTSWPPRLDQFESVKSVSLVLSLTD